MSAPKKSSQPNELVQLISQIPPVTRFALLATFVMFILARSELVSFHWFFFEPYHTFMKLQLWRVFTGSFFLMKKSKLGFVMALFQFYKDSSNLETFHFYGKSHAEYVYVLSFLIFGVVATVTAFRIEPSEFVAEGFMMALAGLWSLKNWNTPSMFYGLFSIRGKYIPLVNMLLSYLFDDHFATFPLIVTGLFVAYVYNCLDTWSLGPFYGFLRGKAHRGYGLVNDGQFRAPWWFKGIWNFFADKRKPTATVVRDKTQKYQGEGRKLGSKSSSDDISSTNLATESLSRQNSETKSTAFSTGAFPGKGQRVGA
ncbi:LANO_0D03224g1_1 [Lachancea nothofagi CBS 11611]|uniref:Derlin n=1 Tax=Lachancea nothofagi CBS 11611 TaxID=1266666 RepID=A0A1G4JFL6_9SACH|nr:LANO_0D03224g1_1 [Lachancea nothofagi CBS 11611]